MRGAISVAVALTACAVCAPAQAQDGQYYVLDGFGGVHAAGGAATITPATPYFGFDIARDLTFVPLGNAIGHGDGVLVLDGFGGVHAGGALAADPPSSTPPYFGFDIARAIVYRNVPPRVTGTFMNLGLSVTSSTFVVLSSDTIVAPDDGRVVVFGTSELHCSGSGGVSAEFSVAINGTTPPAGHDLLQRIPECSGGADSRIYAITHVFPVSAGAHTFNLIGRRVSGTPSLTFTDRSIVVIFVDQDRFGWS